MTRIVPVFSFKSAILRFLAHLNRRLTRWAYSIRIVSRPSVVCCLHFQTWISLKPINQSWSNFMCSITGIGERLRKVLGQIESTLLFPWQQKVPLTYNGEKWCLHLFSVVFDPILFILAGNKDMHKISNEFEFQPDRTTDYGVSCPLVLKNSHRLILEKWCLQASSIIFDRIIIKVAGNQDRHKSSDEFDFGPLVSMAHLYVSWNEIWPWHIGLRWAIVALWATCFLLSLCVPRYKPATKTTRKLWCKASNTPLKSFICVLFYWRSFDEQQAHGPHLLTKVNSYKSLSMHFSHLVVTFLPNYPFGCHINQSN